MEDLKYPIGRFTAKAFYSQEEINEAIITIKKFPTKLENAVVSLSNNQLDTPYREGGWTIRQVVHHCADSHLNSLIRCKLALTENRPTISAYLEDEWAKLPDYTLPIDASLKIIEGTHKKFEVLFSSLNKDQQASAYIHPQKGRPITIAETIMLYAWHGEHHLAHIVNLKQRMNW